MLSFQPQRFPNSKDVIFVACLLVWNDFKTECSSNLCWSTANLHQHTGGLLPEAVMVVVGNMKFAFRMHRMLQRSGKKHKPVFKLLMNMYTAVAGGFA